MENEKLHKKVKLIITLVGIMIALGQFFYCRSLWVDEAMLALNIVKKNTFELLFPLEYNQIAPVLFLELEKFFSLILPQSEYGLRLLPLLSYLAALLMLFSIIQRLFSFGLTQIFALTLFAFNPKLLYYAGEVKPYMGDVAFLTGMYVMVLRKSMVEKKHYIQLCTLGILGIFFSSIAPLVLAAVGLYLLQVQREQKSYQNSKLVVIFLMWLIAFAVYYFAFLYKHPSQEVMTGYWKDVQGFVPMNPFNGDFYAFYFQKLLSLKAKFGTLKLLAFLAPISLLILGIIRLVRGKNYALLFLLFTPLFFHLGLSALHLYPFDTRLVLYLFVPGILVLAYGAEQLQKQFSFLGSNRIVLIFTLAIPLMGLIAVWVSKKQFKREEIKDALAYISQQPAEANDLYVYFAASPAFHYYQAFPAYTLPKNIFIGEMHHDDHRKYSTEICAIAKKKTWLLFSHQTAEQEQEILEQLKAKNVVIWKQFKAVGASVYLVEQNKLPF